MIYQYRDVQGNYYQIPIEIHRHPDYTAIFYEHKRDPRGPLDRYCVCHPFAESLAMCVSRKFQIPHARLVLIEHDQTYRGSTWHLVTFRSNGHRFAYPTRKNLAINEVKAIIFKGRRPTDKHTFFRMMNHANTRVIIEFTAPDKIKYEIRDPGGQYEIRVPGIGYEGCELEVERGTEGKPVIEMVLKDIEGTSNHRFIEIREVQIYRDSVVKVHCDTYTINEIDPYPEIPLLRDDDGNIIIPEPRIMPDNIGSSKGYYPFVTATYDDPPPQFPMGGLGRIP